MIKFGTIFFILICCVYCKKRHNIGTALFIDSDNYKKCWSREDIALLASRKIFEDVLPPETILVLNDKYVHQTMDYFRLVLQVVRKLSYGKAKHLILLALADTIGAYMTYTMIPNTRHAYYAGHIEYDTVKLLNEMYDELKTFIRTNGNGWSKPQIRDHLSDAKIESLPKLTAPGEEEYACRELIYSGAPKRNQMRRKRTSKKHKKRIAKKRKKRQNSSSSNPNPIIIPMPFLDSSTNPSAIAVPFRTNSLRSLGDKNSAYILINFYETATKCILSQTNDTDVVANFHSNYYHWIIKKVIPHLNDNKWYPGFGGVLRITGTMKRNGIMEPQTLEKQIGDFHVMPNQHQNPNHQFPHKTHNHIQKYSPLEPSPSQQNGGADDGSKMLFYIILFTVLSLFVSIIAYFLFLYLRKRKKWQDRDKTYCERMSSKSPSTSPPYTERTDEITSSNSELAKKSWTDNCGLSSKNDGKSSPDKSNEISTASLQGSEYLQPDENADKTNEEYNEEPYCNKDLQSTCPDKGKCPRIKPKSDDALQLNKGAGDGIFKKLITYKDLENAVAASKTQLVYTNQVVESGIEKRAQPAVLVSELLEKAGLPKYNFNFDETSSESSKEDGTSEGESELYTVNSR